MSRPSSRRHAAAEPPRETEKDDSGATQPPAFGAAKGDWEKQQQQQQQPDRDPSDLEGYAGPLASPDEPFDGADGEGEGAGEGGLRQGDGDEEPGGPEGALSRVVSRVLSRTSTKSNPGPPPDGGWKAWTTVACAHLVIVNTWGIVNSFGVFQTYYVGALGRPPADISWIGSVQIFLLFFIGAFTGRLTDAGYFRPVFLTGCAFQAVGIFTAASATRYWQLLLAQGVCMGLGNGCQFCPVISTVATYFARRRGLALGIVACGSATGGLVFPSMARELLPRVGFGWTMRAMGFVQLAGSAVAAVFLRPRLPPRRTGPLVEIAAFRELEYSFYAAGVFFCFMGLYFAFYYLASFSRDVVGLSYAASLNLLLVLNGVGAPGRIIPNLLADRYGPFNVFVPTALAAAACMFGWMGMDEPRPGDSPTGRVAGLYVWAVFYGLVGGGMQSLFPAALSSLAPDLRRAGVRIGMVFSIVSFAVLAGPPIAGAALSATPPGPGGRPRYYGAQAFAGSCLLVGSAFLFAARMVKARKKGGGGGWRVKV